MIRYLILLLCLVTTTLYAYPHSREAQMCFDLYDHTIANLGENVSREHCEYELDKVLFDMEDACDEIKFNKIKTARDEIEDAIKMLELAELDSCNNGNDIEIALEKVQDFLLGLW